jgi:DUF1680 family protein
VQTKNSRSKSEFPPGAGNCIHHGGRTESRTIAPVADGYAAIKRSWAPGDQLELNFPMEPRVIVGNHLNQGNAAVLYGPLVLAADDALLADCGSER